MSRLLTQYQSTIAPALQKSLALVNPHQTPRIVKVVINVGIGDAKDNQKGLEETITSLTRLTGQKPVITKASKSIAGFKIRAGQPIGARVTLRGARMYDFIDRLINIALPRLRDFRGLSAKAFDGHGNYNIGIKEQIIFPEFQYDLSEKMHGMNVTVVTTASSDQHCAALLKELGFPIAKEEKV